MQPPVIKPFNIYDTHADKNIQKFLNECKALKKSPSFLPLALHALGTVGALFLTISCFVDRTYKPMFQNLHTRTFLRSLTPGQLGVLVKATSCCLLVLGMTTLYLHQKIRAIKVQNAEWDFAHHVLQKAGDYFRQEEHQKKYTVVAFKQLNTSYLVRYRNLTSEVQKEPLDLDVWDETNLTTTLSNYGLHDKIFVSYEEIILFKAKT